MKIKEVKEYFEILDLRIELFGISHENYRIVCQFRDRLGDAIAEEQSLDKNNPELKVPIDVELGRKSLRIFRQFCSWASEKEKENMPIEPKLREIYNNQMSLVIAIIKSRREKEENTII